MLPFNSYFIERKVKETGDTFSSSKVLRILFISFFVFSLFSSYGFIAGLGPAFAIAPSISLSKDFPVRLLTLLFLQKEKHSLTQKISASETLPRPQWA